MNKTLNQILWTIVAGIFAIAGLSLMTGFRDVFVVIFCILAIEIMRRTINDIVNEEVIDKLEGGK